MINIYWFICPNGRGHAQRSFCIASTLRSISKKEYNFVFLSTKDLLSQLKFDSLGQVKELTYDTKVPWDFKLKNNIVFNRDDILITDNFASPFKKIVDKCRTFFISSFAWEFALPNVNKSIYDGAKQMLLNKNTLILANKYFVSKHLISLKKEIFFHEIMDYYNLKDSQNIREYKYEIGIIKGFSNRSEEYWIKFCKEILDSYLDLNIGFSNEFLELKIFKDNEKLLKKVDDYKNIIKSKFIISRPTLGTINTLLILKKNFLTVVDDDKSDEIKENSSIIINNGWGLKFSSVKNLKELLYNYEKNIRPFKPYKTNGIKEVAKLIDSYI